MDNNLKGEFILDPKATAEGSDHAQSQPAGHPNKHANHRHQSPHFYTAYGEYPAGVSFADQEEDEEVVLLLRKHFITNLPWIAFSILLAVIPLFTPLVAATFPLPDFSPITTFLLIAFYYLFVFGFVLLNFALWYFHVGLVSDLRILDIDLAGILYRQITVTKHENVEDVTHSQVGFITSLFNFGNVHIQTAGTEVNIEFEQIPRPAKAAEIISDLSKPV